MGGEAQDTIGRRAALRRMAAGTAAVAAGAVVWPETAAAATGTMVYGGTNAAGDASTTLTSWNGLATFLVYNDGDGSGLLAQSKSGRAAWFRQTEAGSSRFAVVVERQSGSGGGVAVSSGGERAGLDVLRESWAVAGAAVEAGQGLSGPVFRATSYAPGNSEPLFEGNHNGVGGGLRVKLANADTQATAVEATSEGKGVAVHGVSRKGRGAVFQGKTAQVRLVPGSLATHPTSGALGDLYLDSGGRLWFCKGGTTWVKLA